MSNFGELVLVLGDVHIPHRAGQIPPQLQRMLVPGKMQHVISTGNVDPSIVDGLSPNVHMVAGDWDTENFPESKVITVGSFRIGVIHGHQLLPWKNNKAAVERLQRKLQVDIIITGNTHQSFVEEEKDYYHINPGSITGAFLPSAAPDQTITPSFILLAVQDTKIVCYVYELVNGEVDVSKTELTKRTKESSSTANPALLDNLLK